MSVPWTNTLRNQINALLEYIIHHPDDKDIHDWEIYDEYIYFITGSKRSKAHLNPLI